MLMTKAALRRDSGSLAALLADTSARDSGHRLVWTLFPHDPAAPRDFLFRTADDGSFVIVSQRPPADPHNLWSLSSRAYEPALREGERLRFVLRANPAVAIGKNGLWKGKRTDAVMHAKGPRPSDGRRACFGAEDVQKAALDWLFRREANIGAAFDREHCVASAYRQLRIPRPGKRSIRFSAIDYEGLLTVTDAVRLSAALANGIGKARAFGCGLMLVRRV